MIGMVVWEAGKVRGTPVSSWNTYSLRETAPGKNNDYTIYRMDNEPPSNYTELQALTAAFHTRVMVNPRMIDGHWLIVQGREVIGVEHDQERLADRAYELAKALALALARREGFKFRDLTLRGEGKPRTLEVEVVAP